MNLREFYENDGIDYNAFLCRLMGKESLAEKYIKIFFTDTTYAELGRAMAEKNYGVVGEKAHTLKGIALNLDFKKLSLLCVDIIGSVKLKNEQDMQEQFDKLKLEYERIAFELNK